MVLWMKAVLVKMMTVDGEDEGDGSDDEGG